MFIHSNGRLRSWNGIEAAILPGLEALFAISVLPFWTSPLWLSRRFCSARIAGGWTAIGLRKWRGQGWKRVVPWAMTCRLTPLFLVNKQIQTELNAAFAFIAWSWTPVHTNYQGAWSPKMENPKGAVVASNSNVGISDKFSEVIAKIMPSNLLVFFGWPPSLWFHHCLFNLVMQIHFCS